MTGGTTVISNITEVFQRAVQQEFGFLVDALDYSLSESQGCMVVYASARLQVNIYLDGNNAIQVDICRYAETQEPRRWQKWKSALMGHRVTAPRRLSEEPFNLHTVLIVVAREQALPPDVSEMVQRVSAEPFVYFRWFGGDTAEEIQSMVQRVAHLSRTYAIAVLRGEPGAFRQLEEEHQRRTEDWRRRFWLEEMPPDMRDECKPLSHSELKERWENWKKAQILLNHPELETRRGLPAVEFLERFYSGRLKD